MPEVSSRECTKTYDVTVVGAGMVGASAALGLADLGYSVLVLEAFELKPAKDEYTPSYDARSTALSWGSREIFDAMGLWQRLSENVCPINTVHVSQKGRFGITKMTASEMSKDALGYVIPNQWLGNVLLGEIEKRKDIITLCSPARVETLSQNEDKSWLLGLNVEGDTKEVITNLLVVADGSNSETSRLLGIDHVVEEYGQHALIANVTSQLPNEGVAYERFTDSGPIALLPLDDYTCALVWTHDSQEIGDALESDERDFCEKLEAQIGSRLGKIERCGIRNSYPLKLVQAREQYRQHLVVLGNAAHSLHPVAGQGFNLALRGVAALLDSLSTHELLDEAVRYYYENQKGDQQRTIMMSDQLVKVFGESSFLMGLARDVGLIGLNNLPVLKQAFAQVAMGVAGRKASIKTSENTKVSEKVADV